jgi:hypothetical protein
MRVSILNRANPAFYILFALVSLVCNERVDFCLEHGTDAAMYEFAGIRSLSPRVSRVIRRISHRLANRNA